MNINIFVKILIVSVSLFNEHITAQKTDCAKVKCPAAPQVCPNGKPPILGPNGCCFVCPVNAACGNRKCTGVPASCSDSRKPYFDGCCFVCKDCANVRCAAPKETCKANQDPRPNGECCPLCKLECAAVSCRRCGTTEQAVGIANVCCPLCVPKDRVIV